MTAKRFTSDGWVIYDGEHRIGMIQASKLLNELSEENEQLRHDATILIQSNQDYREENEQLKEQIEICKDANTRCCNEYSAMRRDVLRYKEENEHIKQTIKDMLENERTELGRSVLRQLWEAIQ